jgi:ribose-phosphate pyrophosphokinase
MTSSDSLNMENDDLILLTGRSNPKLALDIAGILGVALHQPISMFCDGEIRVRIPVNIRRKFVFIVQSTAIPVNDSIMELIFMIDAAKRSSAREIIVVTPYFGYSRQDRKEMPRVPISASAVASMIENAGADRIMTIDIHSEQEEGFIRKPWDNLYGSYSLIPVIKSRNLSDFVVASPDKGGVVRATGYAKLLNATGIAIVYKERDITLHNKSEALDMIGDVSGKNVLLVDDMIDTGGTIVNAANFLKKKGAGIISVAATHGIFSGEAMTKIADCSSINDVIITNTIALSEQVVKNPKVTVVSVAQLLAEAIMRIKSGQSISKDLIL